MPVGTQSWIPKYDRVDIALQPYNSTEAGEPILYREAAEE